MMSVISSVGRPTEVSTMTMVTRPAWGMPAAPMLAAVAVILHVEREHSEAGGGKGEMRQCQKRHKRREGVSFPGHLKSNSQK